MHEFSQPSADQVPHSRETSAKGRAPAPILLSVGFLLADDFTLSALSLFLDALRLTADQGDYSRQGRCRWTIMSPKAEPICSSCGVTINRTSGLADPKQFDYIVVVGGVMKVGSQFSEEQTRYLHQAAEAGVTLVGVCTGSFILCRAGLMQGRRCCVHWFCYQDFIEEFPDLRPVADQLFVVDKDRITCSGGSGVADLAAFLIERHLGRAIAQTSLHGLLLNEARSGSDTQPHPPVETRVDDERVRRALLLMEQQIADPLPIATIAQKLRLSLRQLERLFSIALGMRPAVTYRLLRLRYGRWLLENSARSITEVALEAGFSDCSHFSRQFKELFGITPSEARMEKRKQVIESGPLFGLTREKANGFVPRRLFDPGHTAPHG